MRNFKLLMLFTVILLLASCVTNLKKEQFAIDFTGEAIPIMLNNIDESLTVKNYTFTSGISELTSTRTERSSYGTTTTTTTTADISMSLKRQIAPLLFAEPKFIYITDIRLFENYIIAIMGSREITNLTIDTKIGSK